MWISLRAIPRQDKSVDFAACYPECEVVGGKFTFDLETASDTDLLWAHTKGVAVWTEVPVELAFEHVMHSLVFNFSTNSDEIALERWIRSRPSVRPNPRVRLILQTVL